MSRACLVAGAVAFCLVVRAAEGQPEEPFAPKGDYKNSVHRFFPDLDARLNAVRYGRWRALEIAWTSGIDARSDREFLTYFLRLAHKPPRFDPEASRVAPRLTREAAVLFRALRWGQVLEAQSLDILASPDSTPALASSRLARLLVIYRRDPSALASINPEAPAAGSPAIEAAPASARVLLAGTRLFALAAEDLAASDFGQQRWRVKKTLEAYDFAPSGEVAPEASTFRISAPTVRSRFPEIAEQLDRIAQLRRELFGALVPSPQSLEGRRDRELRLRELARRWGFPAEGMGGR
jgi:hypothetical protein